MDQIRIENLRLQTIIGTNPGERLRPQEIILDLTLACDLARAAETDNLADTPDYFALEGLVAELAERSRFHLLEALAGAVLDAVLGFSPLISGCRITIRKPGASCRGAMTSVTMERTRHA